MALTRTRHSPETLVVALCKLGHQYVVGSRECQDCNYARSRCYRMHNRVRLNAKALVYHSENRDAHNAQMRATQKISQPARLAQNRAWRLANPERTRAMWKKGVATRRAKLSDALGSHTGAEWKAIVARQRSLCAACGDEAKLEKDHVVPLAMGGSDYAWNLQGLCRSCNARKGASIPSGTQIGLYDRVPELPKVGNHG